MDEEQKERWQTYTLRQFYDGLYLPETEYPREKDCQVTFLIDFFKNKLFFVIQRNYYYNYSIYFIKELTARRKSNVFDEPLRRNLQHNWKNRKITTESTKF